MEQRNMCTMKCLITKINNSVIHLYYMFFSLYSTCTMSIINGPITLLNYMLLNITFKFCAMFTSKHYKSTCVVMVQVITYSSV